MTTAREDIYLAALLKIRDGDGSPRSIAAGAIGEASRTEPEKIGPCCHDAETIGTLVEMGGLAVRHIGTLISFLDACFHGYEAECALTDAGEFLDKLRAFLARRDLFGLVPPRPAATEAQQLATVAALTNRRARDDDDVSVDDLIGGNS